MLEQQEPRQRSLHPVNRTLIDEAPLGARIADAVTGFMGSWKFIILQTVVVVIWVMGNVYLRVGGGISTAGAYRGAAA